jgi:hypothetical protein
MIATIYVMPIWFSLGYLYKIFIFQKFAKKKTFLPFRFATKNINRWIGIVFLNDLVYQTLYVCELFRFNELAVKRNFDSFLYIAPKIMICYNVILFHINNRGTIKQKNGLSQISPERFMASIWNFQYIVQMVICYNVSTVIIVPTNMLMW